MSSGMRRIDPLNVARLGASVLALACSNACGNADSGAPPGGDVDGGGGTATGRDGSAATGDSGQGYSDAGRTADARTSADGGVRDAGTLGCTTAGTSDWYTYGHDPMRTSASDGCAMGPFSVSWTFSPSQPQGGNLTDIANAIVTKGAVYVKSSASNNGAQTAAIVDKLSPAGAPSWRWSFGDFEEHQWPTFAFGVLLVEEDSFWLVNDGSGQGTQVAEYDDWAADYTTDADIVAVHSLGGSWQNNSPSSCNSPSAQFGQANRAFDNAGFRCCATPSP